MPANVKGDAVAELGAKLAGFSMPLRPTEDGGSLGYEWPGSRLTDGDMQRLRVLSNMTGLPCNEILHRAVGALFEETRAMMADLLAIHERTGKPLPELLTQVMETTPLVPSPANHRFKDTATATKPAEANNIRLTPYPDDASAETEPMGTSILAAESLPTGPRVQRFFPFTCDEST